MLRSGKISRRNDVNVNCKWHVSYCIENSKGLISGILENRSPRINSIDCVAYLCEVVVDELPEVHHKDTELSVSLGGVGTDQTLGDHPGGGKSTTPASGGVVPEGRLLMT